MPSLAILEYICFPKTSSISKFYHNCLLQVNIGAVSFFHSIHAKLGGLHLLELCLQKITPGHHRKEDGIQ